MLYLNFCQQRKFLKDLFLMRRCSVSLASSYITEPNVYVMGMLLYQIRLITALHYWWRKPDYPEKTTKPAASY
jgi:hypothetical protein